MGTSKNPHFVVPAKAGTHRINHIDSRFRGNDELLEVPLMAVKYKVKMGCGQTP